MKLSTIIIDNDRNTGEHLKELLSANYPKINVVDIINNIETAFQGLVQKNPQLVFLNAKLKDGSAFELLRRFKKRKFDFIIMSTEEIFAIDAIKYGAIDYLVKPIKKKELEACIARLKKFGKHMHGFFKPKDNFPNGVSKSKMLALPTTSGLRFIDVGHIVRCESDNSYTTVFLKDGSQFVVSRSISKFESVLDEINFCRVHQSHLINVAQIKEYVRLDGGFIVMSDQSRVNIAKARRNKLMRILSLYRM